MQDTITTLYCVCADLLQSLEIADDPQMRLGEAEILMTPLVGALYFGGKIERAHEFLFEHGYIKARLGKSRLNRQQKPTQPTFASLAPGRVGDFVRPIGPRVQAKQHTKCLHRGFYAFSGVR